MSGVEVILFTFTVLPRTPVSYSNNCVIPKVRRRAGDAIGRSRKTKYALTMVEIRPRLYTWWLGDRTAFRTWRNIKPPTPFIILLLTPFGTKLPMTDLTATVYPFVYFLSAFGKSRSSCTSQTTYLFFFFFPKIHFSLKNY